jgi:hypothetical protein
VQPIRQLAAQRERAKKVDGKASNQAAGLCLQCSKVVCEAGPALRRGMRDLEERVVVVLGVR